MTHLKIVANVFNQDVFYPNRSRGLFQNMRPKTIHDETKTKLLTSTICVVRTIYPSVPYTSILSKRSTPVDWVTVSLIFQYCVPIHEEYNIERGMPNQMCIIKPCSHFSLFLLFAHTCMCLICNGEHLSRFLLFVLLMVLLSLFFKGADSP